MKHYIFAPLVLLILNAAGTRVWLNPVTMLRMYGSSTSSSSSDSSRARGRSTSALSSYSSYSSVDDLGGPYDLNFMGTIRKEFGANAALINPERDTVCSPISAILPLGKLALGARGRTLEELKNAIGFPRKDIGTPFKKLMRTLRSIKGITIDLASMVYVSDKVRLNEKYISDVTSTFETSIKKLDFGSPSTAASSINRWVSEETHGKIQNLISPGQINSGTTVVLVNAIYFKGKWASPFKVRNTRDETFYGLHGRKTTVKMMHQDAKFNYGVSEALQAKLIELPYEGNEASLVVVLPLDKAGLPILMHKIKLAPELLEDAMKSMTNKFVSLSLPKFKIESTLDLKRLYKLAGLHKIFDEKDSGLTGITQDNTQNIFVGEAVQKAFIEVNEQGTEAAAASAVEEILTSGVITKNKFIANYPFYFFLRAREHNILFSGTFFDVKD